MLFSRLPALRFYAPRARGAPPYFLKQLHTEATEERIKVPWGHVAGKLWGKQSGQPVIALHGLYDNAATFDKLLPLLDIDRPVIALDIPGFGQSSNPPKGLSPSFLEIVLWLRYIIKHHFKLDKVTLLGHSFGSNLSFTYSALYPEEVDKYISIDCSKVFMAQRPEHIIDNFRTAYTGGLKEKVGFLDVGTYEEFLDRMASTRERVGLGLSDEDYRLLLSRDLESIGEDQYVSLVDWRPSLKYIGRTTLPFQEALSKRIKCEVLAIKASRGILIKHWLEIYEKHIENMRKNSPRVVYETVEGGHHVHLDNPAAVAKLINNFLRS